MTQLFRLPRVWRASFLPFIRSFISNPQKHAPGYIPSRGDQRRHTPFWHLLLPLLFTLFLCIGCAASPSDQAENRVVRVEIYENEPKVFTNQNGEADGFFVDLLGEIAKAENWDLVFTRCEWEACLTALETGDIDLMPDVAYSTERDERFDFHKILAAESWSRFYTLSGITIDRLDQVEGKTVAVLQGSIQAASLEKLMQDYGLRFTLVTGSSQVEIFQMAADQQADAAFTNHFFGDYFYEDYGLTASPVMLDIASLYFATGEGQNQPLLMAIDSHLSRWWGDTNSVYYRLMDKWLDKSPDVQLQDFLVILGSIAALLMMAALWIVSLRRQVKHRTLHLEQANKQLSQNEELYRSVSLLTFDYIYSTSVKPDGSLNLDWVAGGFDTITGYTPQEFEAKGGWRAIVHPDDLTIDDEIIARVRENQPVTSELRLVRKTGEIVWLRIFAQPVWDFQQDRLTGVYGATQDITLRRQAEENLNKANALLNITGVMARVGGWEYDVEAGIFNETEELLHIFEMQPGSDFTLTDLLNLFTADARPQISEALQNSILHGQSFYLELPLTTARGTPIWVSVQAEAEKEGEKVTRLFGAVQDVTKHKLSEEKIRQQTLRAEALAKTASNINSKLDLDVVLKSVCEETARALNVPAVVLNMYDLMKQTVSIVADYGFPAIFKEMYQDVPLKSVPSSQPPLNNTPIILEDLREYPDFPRYELMESMDVRTIAVVRIKSKETYIGSLAIFSIGEVREFTADELSLLEGLGNQAAQAITNAHLYENTERQLRNIEALHTIDTAIANSMDIQLTLKVVAEETIKQLGVDAAAILLYKPSTNMLENSVGHGFRLTAQKRVTLQLGEGFAGQVAINWQPIYIPDLTAYHEKNPLSPLFLGEDFVSYYAYPLRAKGQFIGVLEIFKRSRLDPDVEWLSFLENLAGQAAIAIDSIKSFEELQVTNTKLMLAYDATIEGWSRAMDMRDEETEGHTRRVTELTVNVARRVGIPEDLITHIRRGALLHDIGKLGIPDRILLKPGKLTDEEWMVMRRHPQYAYDMLSSIEYLLPALDIPYSHHERWDGGGYPRGLKGDHIPLGARIFSVIDVWDALTSDRPYRPAWNPDKAIEYIKQQSGSHFDPLAVKAFLDELAEDG